MTVDEAITLYGRRIRKVEIRAGAAKKILCSSFGSMLVTNVFRTGGYARLEFEEYKSINARNILSYELVPEEEA